MILPWVVPPPSNSGNEGLEGSPTKNVIILVVTLTGRGDNPNSTMIMIIHHFAPPFGIIFLELFFQASNKQFKG